MSDLLKQKWYLLGQPWTHSDDAGFTIIAGHPNPHLGVCIVDTQDYNDDVDDDMARAIAAHIVKAHNDSLQPAAGAQVTEAKTPSIRKQDIRRIESYIKQLEAHEEAMQKRWGDRKKGSSRSADWHFAEGLRRTLAALAQRKAE